MLRSMTELATVETPYGKFSYWPNDGIGQAISGGAFWDAHFKPVFDRLTRGDRVVDVGAHFGWFSIYAARKGCRVFAFEACPQVFELLKLNVEQNGFEESVSIFPVALYSRVERLACIPLGPENPANQIIADGRIDEILCRNSGSFALKPAPNGLYSQYGVPLDYFNLTAIKLIKIDTEGSDFAILKGARKTILVSKPVICYEWLNAGVPLAEYNALMAEYRYHTEQVHEAMEGNYRDFVARPE